MPSDDMRSTFAADERSDEMVLAEIADDDPGNPHLGVPPDDGEAASEESRFVEVEFRPGARDLAIALVAGPQAFLDAALENAAEEDTGSVRSILLRHGMRNCESSFAAEYIRADAMRLEAASVEGTDGLAADDPVAGQTPLENFVQFEFGTPEDAAYAARELRALPEVEDAVLVPESAPPSIPSDPLIGMPQDGVTRDPLESQWYLHRTSVPAAWALGARGAGVVIADIDWGFRTTHRDLVPNLEMENAFNAFNNDRVVTNGPSRHGTAVLGLAGAAADGRGIAGYAPEADLWPIQGNSGTGLASVKAWADAIEHVRRADSGGRRKVILLEVQSRPRGGNYEQMPSVNRAIRRAIASGVVVVVAAGNGNRDADIGDDGRPIPATGSILVGATAWDPDVNRRASFSNWGPRVVVSAPGDLEHDVTCAHKADNAYSNGFGGTSGAAAKVAGLVALMLSVNGSLSHKQVREILQETGTAITPAPQAPHKVVGVLINAAAAVQKALDRAEGSDALMEQAPPLAA